MSGYRTSLMPQLNTLRKQVLISLDLSFFEPPAQSNEYANPTMNADTFLATFYDLHIGTKSDGYIVAKTSLGKDESNVYDVYKYVFEPLNYERTIIISAGMHATEHPSMFGLALLIGYIVNNPDINPFYRYLRDNVRIICVPLWNPWGFNQSPKVFGNVNSVNINSNFTTQANWDTLVEDAWNMKGTAPFSENEAVLIRDMLLEYKDDAEFWFDLHVGNGTGWDYDQFLYYVNGDYATQDGMSNAVEWLDDRVRTELSREPVDRFMDAETSHKLHYAWSIIGISCGTIEYHPTRYGGENNGSTDLFYYLMHLSNYLLGTLQEHEKKSSLTAYNPKIKNVAVSTTSLILTVTYDADMNCTHELKIDDNDYSVITPTRNHITYSHGQDISLLSEDYHTMILKVTNNEGLSVYKRIVFYKRPIITIASDTFTKGDNSSSLGITETGDLNWTNSNGVFGIASNKAKPTSLTTTTAIATIDSGISDVDVSADIVWNTWAGIVFRYIGVTSLMQARISSTGLAVSDASGNTYGTYSFTPVQGNTYNIRVVANGSSVKVYLDDVERISITNTVNQSSTKVGLKVANEILSTFDNFIVKTV